MCIRETPFLSRVLPPPPFLPPFPLSFHPLASPRPTNKQDVFEETRSILEPAGALSLAGAKAYCLYYGLRDADVIAVTSGANMNFDRLRLVTELADVGARREAVRATTLPEEPGAFKRFAQLVSVRIHSPSCKPNASHTA